MSLAVNSVVVGYGATPVVQGVSHTFCQGAVTALIGPNAAGKTTLLKALARRLVPQGGQVLLDGQPVDAASPREFARMVSYAPQTIPANIALSVGDTVALGRVPERGWFAPLTADDRILVRETLETMDLADLANRPFQELSGGEKQRVVLARMLVQQARVMLLDEPTAHLDPRHQVDLFRQLRQLAADGYTVVVTLHDLSQAATWADEIAMLAGGSIRYAGPPAEVLTVETLKEVYDYDAAIIRHPDSGKLLIAPSEPA